MKYIDKDGIEVTASLLDAPCMIKAYDARNELKLSEMCVEAGNWIVEMPNNITVVFANDSFQMSFTKLN